MIFFLRKILWFPCLLWLCALAMPLMAMDPLAYTTDFVVTLEPAKKRAKVDIKVESRGLLQQMVFKNDKAFYSNIRANGKLSVSDREVVWDLPTQGAWLSLYVKINRTKGEGKYEAVINKNWAIFRGDNIIPAMRTTETPNAYSISRLQFVLPKGWSSVETGWPKEAKHKFIIDNPERLFDRPTGWMIAGKLGTRQAKIKGTQIVVSGPVGENLRRMDVLTFLSFAWREMHDAFAKAPPKLLVVGADDPMWRGGLSAPNSLFLHADRPMVSENGTSPIVHELTHMVTRISAVTTDKTNDDWIAEGIAEFYSFELLYRAKGMTKARRTRILKGLAEWGAEVKHLRAGPSTGQVTARAVVLFDELDKELRTQTKGKHSLDSVVRILMKKRKVSLQDLQQASQSLLGKPAKTLDTDLLR